jgi:hypothetical protein
VGKAEDGEISKWHGRKREVEIGIDRRDVLTSSNSCLRLQRAGSEISITGQREVLSQLSVVLHRVIKHCSYCGSW